MVDKPPAQPAQPGMWGLNSTGNPGGTWSISSKREVLIYLGLPSRRFWFIWMLLCDLKLFNWTDSVDMHRYIISFVDSLAMPKNLFHENITEILFVFPLVYEIILSLAHWHVLRIVHNLKGSTASSIEIMVSIYGHWPLRNWRKFHFLYHAAGEGRGERGVAVG